MKVTVETGTDFAPTEKSVLKEMSVYAYQILLCYHADSRLQHCPDRAHFPHLLRLAELAKAVLVVCLQVHHF